eukprot:g69826.t1
MATSTNLSTTKPLFRAYPVKLVHGGDLRRLKLKSKTIAEAIQSVKKCFGLKTRPFSLSYKDDEGDMIAVYLDQELQEAFEVAEAENKILKLYVQPIDTAPSSTSSDSVSDSTVAPSTSFSTYSESSGTSSDAGHDQRKQMWREKRTNNPTNKWELPNKEGTRGGGGKPESQREARGRFSESAKLTLMAATAAAAAERVKEAEAAAAARACNSVAKCQVQNHPVACEIAPKVAAVTHAKPLASVVNKVNPTIPAPVMVGNKRGETNDQLHKPAERTVGRLTYDSSWNGAWVTHTYKAKFIKDLTYPDRSQTKPSSSVIKTWQVQNSGTVQWPRGTGVKLFRACTRTVAGRKGETERIEIVDPNSRFPVQAATPGQTVDVSVILTTPNSAGRCRAFFRLVTDENHFFGPRMWLDIDIVNPPPEMSGQAVLPPEAEECDELNVETGRDLCEEFEMLRNDTAEEALNDDELYASNPGSNAGSELSSGCNSE